MRARPLPSSWAIACALLTGAACGDADLLQPDEASLLELAASVPTDVSCVSIHVVGSRVVTRSFATTPGETARWSIDAVPMGRVEIAGRAYERGCAEIGGTTPVWVTEGAVATVRPAEITTVELTFLRNERLGVEVEFERDAPTPVPALAGWTTALLAAALLGAGLRRARRT